MDHSTRTSPSAATTRVVDVLVPVALNQTYSYRVPRGMVDSSLRTKLNSIKHAMKEAG